jgi:hypothetical protein
MSKRVIDSIFRQAGFSLRHCVSLSLCLFFAAAIRGQEQSAYRGALADIAGKSSVAILVARLGIVDAKEPERAIVEKALLTDRRQLSRAFGIAYSAIGPPLDKYAKKSKRLNGVRRLADAELIIFFSFLEFRRVLDSYYPYGELYLVARTPNGGKPVGRILWQTRKVMYAGDAAKELVKALKELDKSK